MANNSKLLKEAIADAKAVRETAIANAKIALNEAFTPKLQSMLSRKIEEELEDEEDTVEEQSTSSGIGTGTGVKVADGKDEEKAETKTSSASAGTEGDDTVVDKLTENEDEDEELAEMYEDEDEEEVTEDEDLDVATGEESELDAELAEIIKELEAEDEETAEEGTYEGEEMETETEPVAMEDEELEDEEVTAETSDDEELDLDEIINSLREEDEDEEETVAETEDADDLKDELEEAYAAIKSLKGTINEVNLLNAKLLFSNKLFRSHNLTEGQKMRVIETFDRAANVREVKLVFSTLAESLSSNATRKSSLKEGRASKASKSTRPAKAVIVEANQFNNRMKKLAGLI
tara:strand:+ start:1062 stop:2105 length:1044 start_codon:yes stop_codon:yes gene_type:complete